MNIIIILLKYTITLFIISIGVTSVYETIRYYKHVKRTLFSKVISWKKLEYKNYKRHLAYFVFLVIIIPVVILFLIIEPNIVTVTLSVYFISSAVFKLLNNKVIKKSGFYDMFLIYKGYIYLYSELSFKKEQSNFTISYKNSEKVEERIEGHRMYIITKGNDIKPNIELNIVMNDIELRKIGRV